MNVLCPICYNNKLYKDGLCKKCYKYLYDLESDIPVKRVRTHKNVCGIIKQHHEEMKDDPERLTTDFIQDLINVNCDTKEK